MIWFLAAPGLLMRGIYTLAALLPAFFLLRYIYRQDKVEKEPVGLIVGLLLRGVLAALLAGMIERVGEFLLRIFIPQNNLLYPILMAFLVVAVTEEGAKMLLLKHRTWYDPNFNYRFDGVVYSAAVSLGFAAYENLLYVFRFGLGTAAVRAVLSVPGHTCFAVFMGIWYGRARQCVQRGNVPAAQSCLRRGFLTAVLLHGTFDACLMVNTNLSMMIFAVFVLVTYITAWRSVRRESYNDYPL